MGKSGNAGVDTRHRFTGREWDGESQQYYYRARYYDANTGRVLGQDPLGFAAGDSNLYRYVGNSPAMATDPSGLFQLPSFREGINLVLGLASGGNPTLPIAATSALNQLEANLPQVKDFINQRPNLDLGEKYADRAVDFYGDKLFNDKTPAWQKPGLGLGLGLAALWSSENSNLTFDVLSCALGANGLLQAKGLATNVSIPNFLKPTPRLIDPAGRAPGVRFANKPLDGSTMSRTENCVNCVVAGDAALDGRRATALPSNGPVPNGLAKLQEHFASRNGGDTFKRLKLEKRRCIIGI